MAEGLQLVMVLRSTGGSRNVFRCEAGDEREGGRLKIIKLLVEAKPVVVIVVVGVGVRVKAVATVAFAGVGKCQGKQECAKRTLEKLKEWQE